MIDYRTLLFKDSRPSVKSISSGGVTYNLGGSSLAYGKLDSDVSGAMRTRVERFENARYRNKVEFGEAYDANGYLVGQGRGGGTSARIRFGSRAAQDAVAIMTHNHPSTDGIIGGTFSDADMQWLLKPNMRTIRATSVEGTYSMTRGTSFKGNELLRAYRTYLQTDAKVYQDRARSLNNAYKSGSITAKEYDEAWAKNGNQGFVAAHNWLRNNQKKYGYKYTLERRH